MVPAPTSTSLCCCSTHPRSAQKVCRRRMSSWKVSALEFLSVKIFEVDSGGYLLNQFSQASLLSPAFSPCAAGEIAAETFANPRLAPYLPMSSQSCGPMRATFFRQAFAIPLTSLTKPVAYPRHTSIRHSVRERMLDFHSTHAHIQCIRKAPGDSPSTSSSTVQNT